MTIKFELQNDGTPATYMGPTLYKRDSVGKLRTWAIELEDTGRYRTHAGLAGGKQAVSGWTVPVPASKPTQKEQGEFEVQSAYTHQLEREYRLTEAELADVKDEFVQPMLAKSYDKWPGIGFAQPKLDGIRCIMTAEGMFTREGKPITAVPHLHAAAKDLFAREPQLILDGELYNHDLRDDFGEISSIVRKKSPTVEQLERAEAVMQYHVYDLVDETLTFAERIGKIVGLTLPGWFHVVETHRVHSAEYADELYGKFVEAGYEGGMYRLDEPYQRGRRSKFLLKRKDFLTEEFRVLDIEEGNGNWAGAAKRMVLENDQNDGQPFGAGIRGSYDKLATLLHNWNTRPDWRTDGKFVVTLRFFGRSPDGVPRFPVVIDMHPEGRMD